MRLTKDTVHEIEAAGPWLGKARRLFLGSSHDLLHAAHCSSVTEESQAARMGCWRRVSSSRERIDTV